MARPSKDDGGVVWNPWSNDPPPQGAIERALAWIAETLRAEGKVLIEQTEGLTD